MRRPRDNQRKRLYTAERQITRGAEFKTFAECETFVRKVENSYSWEVLAVKCQTLASQPKEMCVGDGRGVRNALCYVGSGITIPRWARCERVVLHELTHMLVPPGIHASHGKLFAKVLLHLVRRFMGAKAAIQMKAEFDAHNVKYRIAWPIDKVNR